jgi:anaerobic C4-dicarboxylate transporter DcuA
VGLGLWGAVGLMVLVVGFGVNPTSPPIDVMLIILAVIMAASVMDAAGGIDYLVRIAERIIRANPKHVTIVAPLTTWTFTFLAGTGHIVYPLLPVIYETAHQQRHPAGAPDGRGHDCVAAGHHRQPGGSSHRGDDRPVCRERT